MGAAASALDFNGKSVNSIVDKLMPLYYQKDPVTAEDIYLTENSWRVIIEGNSPLIHEMRQATGLHEADGMDLYKELFFSRLFDVHDAARALFSDRAIRSGKFIGAIFQLCFKQLENPKEFRQEMVSVAQTHCQWGIRTVEYGIVGDVLFWSLHKILGDAYTRRLEEAWTRTFSSMLRVIVPVAVAFERDDGKFKKAVTARANRVASYKQFQNSSADTVLLTGAGVSPSFAAMYGPEALSRTPSEDKDTSPELGNRRPRTLLPTIEIDESVSVMVPRANGRQ